MFRQDAEELFRLLGCLQIEIVLADDGLGIARLKCRLPDGAEFRDEIRHERMPHHIMAQRVLLHDFRADMLEVRRDDRELRKRVRPEPRREVWLNRDVAWLPHLGDVPVDPDQIGVELHVLRPEPEDFTVAEAGPNTGK